MQVGGVPAVLKYLLQKGFLHGDCLTVTGTALCNGFLGAWGGGASFRACMCSRPLSDTLYLLMLCNLECCGSAFDTPLHCYRLIIF